VVSPVAKRWKDLGAVLLHSDLVNNRHLEIIEANNPQNVAEYCKQMFMKWQETDKDANWRQLIVALQLPGIELNYLATEIKKMLQKGETVHTVVINSV